MLSVVELFIEDVATGKYRSKRRVFAQRNDPVLRTGYDIKADIGCFRSFSDV